SHLFSAVTPPPPTPPLFPYTTLFRSPVGLAAPPRDPRSQHAHRHALRIPYLGQLRQVARPVEQLQLFAQVVDQLELLDWASHLRSEEHTSELQSLRHLVCRLLLEKKK